MKFIRVSHRIFNTGQIAHVEVFESTERVEIQFAGATEKLSLFGEEAKAFLEALRSEDVLETHRKEKESELMVAAEPLRK